MQQQQQQQRPGFQLVITRWDHVTPTRDIAIIWLVEKWECLRFLRGESNLSSLQTGPRFNIIGHYASVEWWLPRLINLFRKITNQQQCTRTYFYFLVCLSLSLWVCYDLKAVSDWSSYYIKISVSLIWMGEGTHRMFGWLLEVNWSRMWRHQIGNSGYLIFLWGTISRLLVGHTATLEVTNCVAMTGRLFPF